MANLPIDLVKRLYYDEKLSTLEIAKKLDTSPWVVIKFMKKMDLPRRTLAEANHILFEKKPSSFSLRNKLSKEEKELKTAGIMLYWTEGAKLNQNTGATVVDLANSNPRIIQLFLKFLRQICGIDETRLRVFLYCYADQGVEFLKRYWHKVTSIPLLQFSKPYIRKDFLFEKRGKMKYGLIHIRYCDKKLLIKIEEWIEQYLRENEIYGQVQK